MSFGTQKSKKLVDTGQPISTYVILIPFSGGGKISLWQFLFSLRQLCTQLYKSLVECPHLSIVSTHQVLLPLARTKTETETFHQFHAR